MSRSKYLGSFTHSISADQVVEEGYNFSIVSQIKCSAFETGKFYITSTLLTTRKAVAINVCSGEM